MDAATNGDGVGGGPDGGGVEDPGGEKLGGGVEEPAPLGGGVNTAGTVAAELRARMVSALSWSRAASASCAAAARSPVVA